MELNVKRSGKAKYIVYTYLPILCGKVVSNKMKQQQQTSPKLKTDKIRVKARKQIGAPKGVFKVCRNA